MRDGRIKVVPRKNVPPLNFNLRAVFIMSKREELIREYCRQVNESLHFIQKYMEGIVPLADAAKNCIGRPRRSVRNCRRAIMNRPH